MFFIHYKSKKDNHGGAFLILTCISGTILFTISHSDISKFIQYSTMEDYQNIHL